MSQTTHDPDESDNARHANLTTRARLGDLTTAGAAMMWPNPDSDTAADK